MEILLLAGVFVLAVVWLVVRGVSGAKSHDAVAAVIRAEVLNGSERRVFDVLEALVSETAPDHRVLAQVSMGEFLAVDRSRTPKGRYLATLNTFNSKRVDFLIVSPEWQPVVVIEYQGAGHNRGTAAKRDAVKRNVCAQAGVPMVELKGQSMSAAQRSSIVALLSAK